MRFWIVLLTMVALATAQTFSPIIQVDGLGITTLQKDMVKPNFVLGYGEIGAQFTNEPFIFTASLNVSDTLGLTVKDIKAQYQNIDEFGVYIGHTKVPFGSYYTNAVSYSFLRGIEQENDMMFGVTGVVADKHIVYNVAAISNDSATLNAAAAKLDYRSKYVTSDISVQTTLDTTELALGITGRFHENWDLTFRGYKNLDNSFGAGFTELGFYPTPWLAQSIRWDVMGDETSGKSNGSASTLFFLNDNVTLGVEYAILNDIQNKKLENTTNQVSLLASFVW